MIRLIASLLGILLEAVTAVVTTFFDVVTSAVPSLKKQEYDADFSDVSNILHKGTSGIHIGTWSTTLKQAYEHTIIFGGSGTGKSSTITTVSCLRATNVSLVVHTPSKEELNTASAKKKQGYNPLVLDYTNPEASEGVNVLSLCKSKADEVMVARIHVKSTMKQTTEDYWAESAINLISLFISYLRKYSPSEQVHMYSVYKLVQTFSYNDIAIDKLLVQTRDSDLLDSYKSILALPERTRLSVVGTALTALAIYEDTSVQQVTSFNTIDFEQFRKEKTILYICHDASKAQYYGVLTACLFELFWSHLLSERPHNDLGVLFLIDEASSMTLNSLSQTVSLGRKHNLGLCLIYQDYNQLVHQYGNYNASNILANSGTRVFMKNQPLETCQMLEKTLGKFTYIDEDGIKRNRELMTAHEIRQLDKAIVLVSNKPAILLKPVPYFKQKKLLKLTHLPVYEVPNKLPFDTVPVISIPR